jgi:hypothetical protein
MKTAVEQRKTANFFTESTPRQTLDNVDAGAAIAIKRRFGDKG